MRETETSSVGHARLTFLALQPPVQARTAPVVVPAYCAVEDYDEDEKTDKYPRWRPSLKILPIVGYLDKLRTATP